MTRKCTQETCFPEETGCNVEGHEYIKDCKFYNKSDSDDGTESEEESNVLSFPWTGNAFGLSDLNFLTASSNPIVIGITGVASAGKTTFLATLYCLLRNGRHIGNYKFSGSLTLIGWENIAYYLSWKGDNDIQYPPHTSRNAGRVPGLLHIAVRNTAGVKKDLIFTDAPGEWFDNWRYDKNDPSSEGARWVNQNSDAILLFADSEMLSGSKRGTARNHIKSVSDRLKENIGDKPFGLIWSKSDVDISSTIKEQISKYVDDSTIKNYKEFKTSVREGDDQIYHNNILGSVDWILNVINIRKQTFPKVTIQNQSDFFLSKR